jgi:hypothetical protein
MFDVPKESCFMVDEYALGYDPRAEMWRLTVKVGTKEEVDLEIDQENDKQV